MAVDVNPPLGLSAGGAAQICRIRIRTPLKTVRFVENTFSASLPQMSPVSKSTVREQLEISSKIRTALTSGEGVVSFPFCLFVADTGLAA